MPPGMPPPRLDPCGRIRKSQHLCSAGIGDASKVAECSLCRRPMPADETIPKSVVRVPVDEAIGSLWFQLPLKFSTSDTHSIRKSFDFTAVLIGRQPVRCEISARPKQLPDWIRTRSQGRGKLICQRIFNCAVCPSQVCYPGSKAGHDRWACYASTGVPR